MFLRDFRAEIDCREIERIAETLEIAAPVEATADERRQWEAWWKPSYEAALTLPDAERAYLKSGGWWPPLCASMIGRCARDRAPNRSSWPLCRSEF